MNIPLQNLCVLLGAVIFLLAVRLCWKSRRWERAMARLRRDKLAKVCTVVIVMYASLGLLDSITMRLESGHPVTVLDWFFRNVPKEKSYSAPMAKMGYEINRPQPLSGFHLLGTNVLGQDVLQQTLKASRTALIIGGLTSLILIPIGVILGIAAGYYKKWVDDIIQYLYSTISSIPHILLLIAVLMVLGRGLTQMSLALGLTGWVGLCRLIRGETFRQSERTYVEAARALGQNHRQIILRHLLPNIMHLVIINFVLGFSGLILAEAILSYIGVGAPLGTASWGLMIDSARMELAREPAVWWSFASASVALFILVLALNLLGDSLRKAFDPRTSF